MDSFTFSLRFCLRGGKFLPGYIFDYAFKAGLRKSAASGWDNCGLVRIKDKGNLRQFQCTPKEPPGVNGSVQPEPVPDRRSGRLHVPAPPRGAKGSAEYAFAGLPPTPGARSD